jgi:hypothetical protein
MQWNGEVIVRLKANQNVLSLSTTDSVTLPTKYTQRIKAKPIIKNFPFDEIGKTEILCHICDKSFSSFLLLKIFITDISVTCLQSLWSD